MPLGLAVTVVAKGQLALDFKRVALYNIYNNGRRKREPPT